MSIVNFCLTPERISVVTDTLLYDDRQPCALGIGKAAHNGRYAVACRGRVSASTRIVEAVQSFHHTPFDLAVAEIAALPVRWARPGNIQEAYFFGYSELCERMKAIHVRWTSGSEPGRRREFDDGVFMNPSVPLPDAGLPKIATDEQLFRVALAHYNAPRRHSLTYCVGGVCHLTEVDRAGASQRIIGLFPDYEEMARRFGDPLNREVADWRGEIRSAQAV